MASQKKAQGGFPQNMGAMDDTHSTTGDGHPPRTAGKTAKTAKTGSSAQGKSAASTQSKSGGSKSSSTSGKGMQAPSRQKK